MKVKVKVKGEGEERKAKKLPIWKTAKHSTEVVAKVTLPHVVDSFEVKYVMFPDYHVSRDLANQCWDEYMEATRVAKKGGAK